MLRKVLGTVLLLGALVGCSGPASTSTCKVDADCGEGTGLCDVARGLCFAPSDAGDEPEVDPTLCEPRCASYQACTASRVCAPRYTALAVTPGNGSVLDGGVVPVTAELVLGASFNPSFPESLSFSVVRNDGGTVEALTPVARDAGVYTTQWTPPGEGVFLLTAAYPEAGGPSTTVQLTVDKTPPTFVVTVSPADAGVATDGGATYGDPSLANAWRRDQVVPVEIRTNEPNLDPTSLTVALRGTDGGIAPTVGVTSLTGACDAGFCGVAQLKLWEPALDDFRAALPIIVQGRDRAGNVGSTSATSVNVTRWKWVFDASSGGIFSIKSAPAIGAQGVVYVGTAAASTGKVFAIEAEGARKWESSVGAVTGGLVVGAPNGATELVYVGANGTSSGDLYALQGDDGGTRQRCPFGPGSFAGVLALGSTTAAQLETAVSVYNGSSAAVIAGIRPGSGSPCPQTESPSTGEQIPQITSGSPVVMQNDNIFFSGPGTMTFKVTSYTFGVGSPRSNWPVDVAHAPRSLALVGTDVVGAAASTDFFAGGLFKVPQVGATSVTRLFPASTPWSSRVFSFAVGSGENVFFGAEPTASAEFNRLNLSTLAVQTSASGAAIRATPITGRNGTVYTITTTGIVRAWDADGPSPRWTLSPALGTVDASPTIDCPRDATGAFVEGNHGVLYVPAGGKLYAFVVDSRGLDPNAPWPKFQHDARNTGNPATPITSCP